MENDGKSVRTDWSDQSNDDGSYLKPDFHDLALRHSKQNVHRCNSAFCRTCRPNLGVVHMVSVSKGGQKLRQKQQQGKAKLPKTEEDQKEEYPACPTINEAPEALGNAESCFSDDDDDVSDGGNSGKIPQQVAFATSSKPFGKKSKTKNLDPPEQQPPAEAQELKESLNSGLPTEDDAAERPSVPPVSPPPDGDDKVESGGKLFKKKRKPKKSPRAEASGSSPYDETDYSFYDNNANNDGFTFVRIANAKRSSGESDEEHNGTVEPSHEVAL